MNILRKKTVKEAIEQTEVKEHSLKRSLTSKNLALMGVSVVVGAGIFSVSARQAAYTAGPSVILGFLIAAMVCAFATLCFAEFASSVPVAGSSYTFSYIVMGELIAFVIGWDILLESLLATSIIAKYWGIYFADFFHIANPVIEFGFVKIDIVPVILLLLVTLMLIRGTKLSATVAGVITVIKIAVILFLIVVGAFYFTKSNLSPFIPPSEHIQQAQISFLHKTPLGALFNFGNSKFGFWGVITSASVLFFAFIGFDFVASAAEETKNPKKDLPKGLLGGLAITVVLYVGVSLAVTGMVKYSDMANYALKNNLTPTLGTAFDIRGVHWASSVISFGAMLGLTTVVVVCLLALSRIVFAISRDGLFPKWLSKTSPKYKTPVKLQIILLIFTVIVVCCLSVEDLEDMINIGTLLAFAFVSFSLIKSRNNEIIKPAFKVPFSPVLPAISGIACIWMVLNLPVITWIRYVVWLIIGLLIYFGYSYKHSNMNKEKI